MSHRLRGPKAPPPRRVVLSDTNTTNTVDALNAQGGVTLTGTLHPGIRPRSSQGLVLDYMSVEGIGSYMPSREEITGTSAWLAVRAFAIATAGVVTVFGTGISLFIWSWDIRNVCINFLRVCCTRYSRKILTMNFFMDPYIHHLLERIYNCS